MRVFGFYKEMFKKWRLTPLLLYVCSLNLTVPDAESRTYYQEIRQFTGA